MSPDTTRSPRGKLDTPRSGRRPLRIHVDSDIVGFYSERLARFLGTGRYLAIQTVIVVVWILLNTLALGIGWDPYPFILLNLAFSTQAAYAAPLILLAQNRQENRDRVALEEDRMRAEQTKADTEFLARELAAVRLAVGDTVTRDYLRKELDDLLSEMTAQLKKSEKRRAAEYRTGNNGTPDTKSGGAKSGNTKSGGAKTTAEQASPID